MHWLPAIALCLFGCAHYPVNPRLERFDPSGGYRFRPGRDPQACRDLVILTFSGGGTRAAAFAYGTLKALDAESLPGADGRSLLDEVDLISSVSGGSFTAAWYGLYGKSIFDGFERSVLRRNIQGELAGKVANPLNWCRLASGGFDRIDLAAEHFDRKLFAGKTFADLPRDPGVPFIMINASDISAGARFEFTQDQFDLLYSDLDKFPIGRAVAASAAFPVLLTPVRLVNHSAGPDFVAPIWIETALQDADTNPWRFLRASVARSYLDSDPGCGKHRRYLHLLDGGISDNIGLRGPMVSLTSTDAAVGRDGSSSLLNLINSENIDRVAVIVVDAKNKPGHDWDRQESSPSVGAVLSTVCTTPMDNYSTDTVQLVDRDFEARLQDQDEREAVRDLLREHGIVPDELVPVMKTSAFHLIHLHFGKVRDELVRRELENLPTSLRLRDGQIDLLIQTAKTLLKESQSFQNLLTELRTQSLSKNRSGSEFP